MEQNNGYAMNQETAEAVNKLLFAKLCSGGNSDLLAVVGNEMATREYLLEAAALCAHMPFSDSLTREQITSIILGHKQADDTVASILCNNGYFALWMMVAQSACAGKHALSKLVVKCQFVESQNRQKELAEAILSNPNVTLDITAAMACYEKAPYARQIAQARLLASSGSLPGSGEDEIEEEIEEEPNEETPSEK